MVSRPLAKKSLVTPDIFGTILYDVIYYVNIYLVMDCFRSGHD